MTRDAHDLDRVRETTPDHRLPGADARLAAALADAAGSLLRDLHGQVDAGTRSGAIDDLSRAGDATSHACLAAALAARAAGRRRAVGGGVPTTRASRRRTASGSSTRSTAPASSPSDAGGGWRDDFAVHVALWQRGARPHRRRRRRCRPAASCTASDDAAASPRPGRGRGARRASPAAARRQPDPPAGVVAASAERAGVDLVPMGSAGVKIVRRRSTARPTPTFTRGGQYEWDSAAPVAVARAGRVRRETPRRLAARVQPPDPWSPDLVVCHPALDGRPARASSRRGHRPERQGPAA